jgi:membrane protease YdiL (CAAX protease family)
MNGASSSLSARRDAVALTFALLFPAFMAWIYFVVLAGPGQQANPAFLVAFSAGKCVQFAFPALYALSFDRASLRPARPSLRGLVPAVGFALLVAVALFVLYFGFLQHSSLLRHTPTKIHERLREFGRDSPAGFVQVALFICVVHSLFEEYYWRWFVFGRMRQHLMLWVAIALASVGFMLHHIVILGVFFPGRFWLLALPFSACVGIGGAVWAWLYDRAGSLLAPWLCHALIDAAIMVVGYAMLRPFWME